MKYFEQPPLLKRKGEKERKNELFAYRPHELEEAICCCLGDRDTVAIKTMLFFTGNSNEGDFRVAQKTIFDRMNISEKRYYEARKKLQEMGWIQYVKSENVIYVCYDKIYADYKKYQEENKVCGSNDSSNSVSIYDSPGAKELQEQSSEMREDSYEDSQQDSYQDRYNNIKNNKTNNKSKKINSGACAAVAAPPQELIDKAFAYRNHREYWDEYMKDLEQWVYGKIAELGIEKDTEEYKQKYNELASKANQCLHIMYGYINSYDEDYKEQRWY